MASRTLALNQTNTLGISTSIQSDMPDTPLMPQTLMQADFTKSQLGGASINDDETDGRTTAFQMNNQQQMMFDKKLSMKRGDSKPRPSLPIPLQSGSQTISKKWEFASEIESKSFFKCCFNRLHQDEELDEGEEIAI